MPIKKAGKIPAFFQIGFQAENSGSLKQESRQEAMTCSCHISSAPVPGVIRIPNAVIFS